MINIGHSPILLKNILLWFWHEASLSREDIENLLQSRNKSTGKLKMYSWVRDANKAHWQAWKVYIEGINEILNDYGMSVFDFDTEHSYTPENLTNLREKSGLTLDEFSEIIKIPAKDLLVFESDSSINNKGISYQKYLELQRLINSKGKA